MLRCGLIIILVCFRSKVWDLDITWNTEYPDFTSCFKFTLLNYIPAGILFIGERKRNFNFKKAMSDHNDSHLYLINNVKDIVVFLAWKLFLKQKCILDRNYS